MTERAKRKPAAAGRILTLGGSLSASLLFVGALGLARTNAGDVTGASVPAAATPSRIVVRIVRRHHPALPLPPRIVHRYVQAQAQPVTRTHGS